MDAPVLSLASPRVPRSELLSSNRQQKNSVLKMTFETTSAKWNIWKPGAQILEVTVFGIQFVPTCRTWLFSWNVHASTKHAWVIVIFKAWIKVNKHFLIVPVRLEGNNKTELTYSLIRLSCEWTLQSIMSYPGVNHHCFRLIFTQTREGYLKIVQRHYKIFPDVQTRGVNSTGGG